MKSDLTWEAARALCSQPQAPPITAEDTRKNSFGIFNARGDSYRGGTNSLSRTVFDTVVPAMNKSAAKISMMQCYESLDWG